MSDKPRSASEYRSEQTELVRSTCLYVATKLGDMTDDIVVVGGLVPSLLIHPETLPDGTDAHVGTMDLDIGLTLALLDDGRYKTLTERLRAARFRPDTSDKGHPTRQRWKVTGAGGSVTVDFLIPSSLPNDKGGGLRDIEPDFAAFIAPGLQVAFVDRDSVTIDGRTIFGERAVRKLWICGAGAFVVLKALAFDGRGENKDAYDLYYVVRNYGSGTDDVVARLRPILHFGETQTALAILRRDFLDPDNPGPMRVAEFIAGGPDQDVQADVVGFISRLLDRLERSS
jgi:hypothetical protein